MKWQYKGEWYESIKADWEELLHNPYGEYASSLPKRDDWVLYVPKWDKCYKRLRFGIFGNGNHIKFELYDIYHGGQFLYCMAKDVELVVKVV